MARRSHRLRRPKAGGAVWAAVLLSVGLLLLVHAAGAESVRHDRHPAEGVRTTTFTLHGDGMGLKAAIHPRTKETWVETVSWKPRAFLIHNLLSDEECEHVIELASPKVKQTTVIHANGTTGVDASVRTAWGTFLEKRQDAIVKAIEERVALITGTPTPNGEAMNVLR